MITMDEVGGEEDGDDEGHKDCSGYDSLAHIIAYLLCTRDKKALNINQFGQKEIQSNHSKISKIEFSQLFLTPDT